MPETKRWHLSLFSFMLLVSNHSVSKKLRALNLSIKLFRSLSQARNIVYKLPYSLQGKIDQILGVKRQILGVGTPLINSSDELKDVLTLVLCHCLERKL